MDKRVITLVNYIYISHNHPDHLHLETLSKFDKNINIITPKFQSGSTVKLLKRAGFKIFFNVILKNIFQLKIVHLFLLFLSLETLETIAVFIFK